MPRRRLLALAFLALLGLLALGLRYGGLVLIEADDPAPADAIVVLAGNSPDRLTRGLELRAAGYARLVVVSNERVHTHGLETDWLALHRAGMAAPDLPDADLVVLDDPPPESTIDEARRAAAALATRGARSALLVTDAFHSRRAALLFRAAFARRGMTVRSTPARDSFDLVRWWSHPLAARRVTEEWTKLAYYFVQGAFW